jgi:hypothetical protein
MTTIAILGSRCNELQGDGNSAVWSCDYSGECAGCEFSMRGYIARKFEQYVESGVWIFVLILDAFMVGIAVGYVIHG